MEENYHVNKDEKSIVDINKIAMELTKAKDIYFPESNDDLINKKPYQLCTLVNPNNSYPEGAYKSDIIFNKALYKLIAEKKFAIPPEGGSLKSIIKATKDKPIIGFKNNAYEEGSPEFDWEIEREDGSIGDIIIDENLEGESKIVKFKVFKDFKEFDSNEILKVDSSYELLPAKEYTLYNIPTVESSETIEYYENRIIPAAGTGENDFLLRVAIHQYYEKYKDGKKIDSGTLVNDIASMANPTLTLDDKLQYLEVIGLIYNYLDISIVKKKTHLLVIHNYDIEHEKRPLFSFYNVNVLAYAKYGGPKMLEYLIEGSPKNPIATVYLEANKKIVTERTLYLDFTVIDGEGYTIEDKSSYDNPTQLTTKSCAGSLTFKVNAHNIVKQKWTSGNEIPEEVTEKGSYRIYIGPDSHGKLYLNNEINSRESIDVSADELVTITYKLNSNFSDYTNYTDTIKIENMDKSIFPKSDQVESRTIQITLRIDSPVRVEYRVSSEPVPYLKYDLDHIVDNMLPAKETGLELCINALVYLHITMESGNTKDKVPEYPSDYHVTAFTMKVLNVSTEYFTSPTIGANTSDSDRLIGIVTSAYVTLPQSKNKERIEWLGEFKVVLKANERIEVNTTYSLSTEGNFPQASAKGNVFYTIKVYSNKNTTYKNSNELPYEGGIEITPYTPTLSNFSGWGSFSILKNGDYFYLKYTTEPNTNETPRSASVTINGGPKTLSIPKTIILKKDSYIDKDRVISYNYEVENRIIPASGGSAKFYINFNYETYKDWESGKEDSNPVSKSKKVSALYFGIRQTTDPDIIFGYTYIEAPHLHSTPKPARQLMLISKFKAFFEESGETPYEISLTDPILIEQQQNRLEMGSYINSEITLYSSYFNNNKELEFSAKKYDNVEVTVTVFNYFRRYWTSTDPANNLKEYGAVFVNTTNSFFKTNSYVESGNSLILNIDKYYNTSYNRSGTITLSVENHDYTSKTINIVQIMDIVTTEISDPTNITWSLNVSGASGSQLPASECRIYFYLHGTCSVKEIHSNGDEFSKANQLVNRPATYYISNNYRYSDGSQEILANTSFKSRDVCTVTEIGNDTMKYTNAKIIITLSKNVLTFYNNKYILESDKTEITNIKANSGNTAKFTITAEKLENYTQSCYNNSNLHLYTISSPQTFTISNTSNFEIVDDTVIFTSSLNINASSTKNYNCTVKLSGTNKSITLKVIQNKDKIINFYEYGEDIQFDYNTTLVAASGGTIYFTLFFTYCKENHWESNKPITYDRESNLSKRADYNVNGTLDKVIYHHSGYTPHIEVLSLETDLHRELRIVCTLIGLNCTYKGAYISVNNLSIEFKLDINVNNYVGTTESVLKLFDGNDEIINNSSYTVEPSKAIYKFSLESYDVDSYKWSSGDDGGFKKTSYDVQVENNAYFVTVNGGTVDDSGNGNITINCNSNPRGNYRSCVITLSRNSLTFKLNLNLKKDYYTFSTVPGSSKKTLKTEVEGSEKSLEYWNGYKSLLVPMELNSEIRFEVSETSKVLCTWVSDGYQETKELSAILGSALLIDVSIYEQNLVNYVDLENARISIINSSYTGMEYKDILKIGEIIYNNIILERLVHIVQDYNLY